MNEKNKKIIECYINGESGKSICSKMKIGFNTFKKILKKNNIHMRSLSESLILAHKKYPEKFKHSEKTKKIMSLKRKNFLKEHPDKHNWKNSEKFKSPPCEYLKKELKKKGVNFIEEYQPLDNRFYSIDIVIKNKKIALEVNGNQHYNKDKTLKKYYQERHDNIRKNGWKIYEIYYTKCYSDIFIDDLIRLINNDIEDIDLDFILMEKKENNCGCGKYITKAAKYCNSCVPRKRKVERPPYDQLLKELAEANYSKLGRKYGVSDTSIRKWIKYYEKQYETE